MSKLYPLNSFSGIKTLLLSAFIFLSLHCFPQPSITSFSPVSGPVGTTVTINGANFSTTPSNNIVYFGAVKANVTAATTISLTVTVPAGTTYQPITVTVNNLTAYSNKPFNVTFTGAAPEFTTQSFEEVAHVDSIENTETTKYAIGDLDNDGKIDVVTIDRLSNTMSVYRNTTTSGIISFGSKIDFTTGQSPRSVTVGDIDGDGKLDVVISNLNDNTVSIFRNTTSGGVISFASRVNFATATQPAAISITDLDKDGKPDLVVNTINLQGYVSVLRNTSNSGTISFASKIDLQSVGGSIEEIRTADMDGDGKADIVIPNYGLNSVSIFRNTSPVGSISFAAKMDIGFCCNNPFQLEIADLNDDGKPDLIVSYYLSYNVSIARNTSTVGSISVASSVNYSTGSYVDGISINDLDGDGKPDIAISSGVDSASVFKNISPVGGEVEFNPMVKYGSLWDSPILSADFDNDGKPDFSFKSGIYRVTIWKNKTTEPQITSFFPDSAGQGMTVAINGYNISNVDSVYFGGVPATSFTIVNSTTITAIVDSGSSGDVTLVTSYGIKSLRGFTFVPRPTISSVSPLLGGSGSMITLLGTNLSSALSVRFGGVPASSFVIVSANEITAVVDTGSSGTVSVTTLGGSAIFPGFIFVPLPVIDSFSPSSGGPGTVITINGADFTGVTSVSFGGIPAPFTVESPTKVTAIVAAGASGSVSIITPGGTGSFMGFTYITPSVPTIASFTPTSGPVGTSVTISGSNFNSLPGNNIVYFGSVRAIVNTSSTNQITVTVPYGATYLPISVLNTATGRSGFSSMPFIITFPVEAVNFDYHQDFPSGGSVLSGPEGVALGDFDGDGRPDIVVANIDQNSISVFHNTTVDGMLFFQKSDYSTNANDVFTGDLDGDGKPDIVVVENNLTIFRNTSVIDTISFAPKIELTTGYEPVSVWIADIDNDGLADIVTANQIDGTVSVFRNIGGPGYISFAQRVNFSVGANPSSLSVNDFDGDGKPDIATSNTGSNTISILRNMGATGNIAFANKVDVATGNNPSSICSADFDRDGKVDVAVANRYDNTISVLKNFSTAGNITFAPKIDYYNRYIVGSQQTKIITTDLDGDGKTDLAVSSNIDVQVFKNMSILDSLSFASLSYSAFFTSGIQSCVAAGDLDMDGKPDLSVTNYSEGNISVLRNNSLPAPTITSFTQTSAYHGATVIITGTNFWGVTDVSFGGVPAINFDVYNYTTYMVIEARVGEGATGDVTVTTPAGTATANGFTFIPPPMINSFTPTHASQGDTVTIRGKNFYDLNNGISGGISVTFGGVYEASFVYGDSTTIVAIVGAGASGDVTVINLAGSGSLSGFTYDIVTAVGNVTGNSNDFRIYPNPAKNYLVAEHPASNKSAYIQCVDIAGRIIKTVLVKRNDIKTEINTENMSSGVYRIVWSDGNRSFARTVMISK